MSIHKRIPALLLGVILLVLYLVLAGCSVRKKQPEEDTI